MYCPNNHVIVMFIQLYTPGMEDKSRPRQQFDRVVEGGRGDGGCGVLEGVERV